MRRFASVLLVLAPALVATALIARGVGDLAAMIYFPPSTATVVPMPVVSASPPEAKQVPIAAPPKPAPEIVVAPCAIGSRVVVLVSDEDRPDQSMAVLSWPGAVGFSRPMVRRGSVIGGHRVAAITASRVWLEDRGRTCFLDSSTEQAAPKTAPVVVATKGIDRVDDTHARIDRTVRDSLLDKGAAAFGNVRIAPDVVGGKVVGMKLLGVPEGSPLAKMGLRTGDTLVSINGFDLTTSEGALEAFSRLRAAPSLEVSIRRNGAPAALRVDVI
jgi:general secretion pathway protein C